MRVYSDYSCLPGSGKRPEAKLTICLFACQDLAEKLADPFVSPFEKPAIAVELATMSTVSIFRAPESLVLT